MAKKSLQSSTLQFLKKLAKNNDREWFKKNRASYDNALEDMKELFTALEEQMNKHDQIEDSKLFRIYRDVRFSKDKSPYKTHLAGSMVRAGAERRGGYYLQIAPGGSFVAGGFWAPEKDDLKRIRDEFAHDDKPIRKIIGAKKFKDHFGSLEGDSLKTAPKGFDKDHRAIDLIRMKQFIVTESFSDADVVSDDFVKKLNNSYKAMRPYFDYMSEVLTTDLNGVSLIAN